MVTGTTLPALALYLARTGQSKAFCNTERGIGYDVVSFFVVWVVCDFYEWFYHYLGHRFAFMVGVWKLESLSLSLALSQSLSRFLSDLLIFSLSLCPLLSNLDPLYIIYVYSGTSTVPITSSSTLVPSL